MIYLGAAFTLRIIIAGLVTCLAVPAIAQESRVDELARQRDEKVLTPNVAGEAERFFDWVERYVTSPNQWYVTFGNLMPSSGLAPGVGYRRVLGDVARFNLRGAWSVRSYTLAEAVVEAPLADERIVLSGRARWRDGNQLPYYGVGDGSSKDQRTGYAMQIVDAGGSATFWPSRWFSIGAGASALLIETSVGKGRFPSIETSFDPTTAPGLESSPDYLHSNAIIAIDWRESPGYTRSGGYYAVTLNRYDDRSDGRFTFNQVDADVRQFIPVLNEHWVIALRGLVSITDTKAGQEVPHFMLPRLGGSTTMRAYPDGRFRDRHAMLLSAEYRWIPGRVLDMALFVDAGKVAAERADLDFEDLRTSYGIGARFHAPAATVVRLEAAHGLEGYRLHFTFGKSF